MNAPKVPNELGERDGVKHPKVGGGFGLTRLGGGEVCVS